MNIVAEKLVILARGLGTRMRRADAAAAIDPRQAAVAATGLKAMIPIGRPFLDYLLSAAAAAGLRRVCLIVGPEHDAMRRYYEEEAPPRRIEISFAVQLEPKGTADAVLAAERFAAGDPILVVNSDNYYPAEALRRLVGQDGSAVALFDREGMIAGSNVPAARIAAFAVGEIDARGRLVRIVEKPDAAFIESLPRPIWVSMNCWRFGPAIFEACRAIGPSPRGELEITTAVQHAIDVLGEPFHAVTVSAPVLDLSSREDIGPVAARLRGMEVDF
jgi:glucose-1-phosphate thymidylyltransferase